MRFMLLMIPRLYQPDQTIPEDFVPPAEAVERMDKYNAELEKAGVLLTLDGLHPPLKGGRISYKGGKAITDGPFAEAKEVLGGYWIIQVKSKEEAIEWAKRVPADDGDVVEVRQIGELTDYPEDVQRAMTSHHVKS